MTAQSAVRAAWAEFLQDLGRDQPAYAVTLAYNNHRQGTAGPCYQIMPDGECLRLGGSGVAARYGVNRLSGAYRVPPEQVRFDLDRLHAQVDRKLLGTRFHRLPQDQRSAYVGFIEHRDYNLHVHLSWSVPEARASNFASVVSAAWQATGPAATIDVQPVRDAGWGRYVVKDQWGAALDDATLLVASRPGRG